MKLVELIKDPTSNQLSASRLGMLIMIIMMVSIDIASIYLMLLGKFQSAWFTPLAVMHSSTIASLGLVYYGNSKAGAEEHWKVKREMCIDKNGEGEK